MVPLFGTQISDMRFRLHSQNGPDSPGRGKQIAPILNAKPRPDVWERIDNLSVQVRSHEYWNGLKGGHQDRYLPSNRLIRLPGSSKSAVIVAC